MITLKTIKSGDPEVSDINLDLEGGYYYLKQDDDWATLTKQSLIELGQYLVKLDLD